MRDTLMFCCLFVLTAVALHGATQSDEPGRQTRKGDSLSVKGCLSGSSLVATETSAPDVSALLTGGLTFRLKGDRAMLRKLREKHDRRIVEVNGVLDSNLPQIGAQPRRLGRTGITIGAVPPSAGRLEAESRRSLPVLEVKAFDGSHTFCGR